MSATCQTTLVYVETRPDSLHLSKMDTTAKLVNLGRDHDEKGGGTSRVVNRNAAQLFANYRRLGRMWGSSRWVWPFGRKGKRRSVGLSHYEGFAREVH
jgi:hypothetical protein